MLDAAYSGGETIELPPIRASIFACFAAPISEVAVDRFTDLLRDGGAAFFARSLSRDELLHDFAELVALYAGHHSMYDIALTLKTRDDPAEGARQVVAALPDFQLPEARTDLIAYFLDCMLDGPDVHDAVTEALAAWPEDSAATHVRQRAYWRRGPYGPA